MEINHKDKVVIKDARIRAAKLLLKAAEGEGVNPRDHFPGTSMAVSDALQWVFDAFGVAIKPSPFSPGVNFPTYSVSAIEGEKQEEIISSDYVDDSVIEDTPEKDSATVQERE